MSVYYKKIDGLRCIAILLVLFEHFPPWLGRFIQSGYYGVDLFFVLSGFLITGILLRSNESSFFKAYGIFLGRRSLRIFPIYYLTILILYLCNDVIVQEYLFWFITYTYNYAWSIYDIPISRVHPFWSLSVEEQFYIFWPLVVLGLRKYYQWLFCAVLVIIVIAFLQFYFDIIPTLSKFNKAGLLTRMLSLGIGAFAAIYIFYRELPKTLFNSKLLEVSIIFFLLPLVLYFNLSLKFLILPLISLYLVLKAALFDFRLAFINKFLTKKWVTFIGSISYGIYIYHTTLTDLFDVYVFSPVWNNVDFSLIPKLQWHPWLFKMPLFTAITIAIAYLSFVYIEKPLLRLKDKKFSYSSTS